MKFIVTFQFLELSHKLNKLRPLRIDLAPKIDRMSHANELITFSNGGQCKSGIKAPVSLRSQFSDRARRDDLPLPANWQAGDRRNNETAPCAAHQYP